MTAPTSAQAKSAKRNVMAKPRRTAKAVKAPPAAVRKVVPIRRNADIPKACPLCGSKALDVQKADGPATSTTKVVASLAIPFMVVRTHPAVACRACGWRAEAVDGGF